MFNKKKKTEALTSPEKAYQFDYMVEFLDGTLEARTGEVRAIHFVNAVDKAMALIETRTEADEYIKGSVLYGINLDEEEYVI